MTPREPAKSTFTKLPHWLAPMFADGTLKDGTMRVYYAIGMFVDWSTGRGAFPSIATLCRVTNLSERTVQKHIGLLLAVGAIERHARFRADGSQTSSEVWLIEDPPDIVVDDPPVTGDTPPSPDAPPPVTDDTPIPRAPYQEPSSPPAVVEPPTRDDPVDSPTVPSSGHITPLPVVLRRMLTNSGVTESAMPSWEMAWVAAQHAEWPDWAEVEATRFYADHLPIYLSKTVESGRKPSPGTWLDWFHRDRVRQQEFLRARLEQENRFAEDPAEREARQNRHLPPDRSGDLDFLDNTPEGQAMVAEAQRRTREAKQARTGVQP